MNPYQAYSYDNNNPRLGFGRIGPGAGFFPALASSRDSVSVAALECLFTGLAAGALLMHPGHLLDHSRHFIPVSVPIPVLLNDILAMPVMFEKDTI